LVSVCGVVTVGAARPGAARADVSSSLVHAFLAHQLSPDEDFDSIVAALKEQAQYWGLASELI
jgi:hypothetical protein